jgi:hypothetical protein
MTFVPLSQNFDAIVLAFNAIFATLSGIPVAQGDDQSAFFGQIGEGTITDKDGHTVRLSASNSQARITWDVLGIEGIGWDEWRKTYDPDAVIPGDTYAGPGAPLGGIVYETTGNRGLRIQVKVECFDQSNGHSAHPLLERVRTGRGLPTICDALAAVGLGWREISKSTTTDYKDDNGRQVSVALFEIVFNAADSAIDDPVGTLETFDMAVAVGTR